MYKLKLAITPVIIAAFCLLTASGPGAAAADATLAQLAARADVIALVRVMETDYEKIRSFPSSGWALLKVLIPYKGVARDDILEVTEKGLRDSACYYPELGVWQFEGDRFLVFLRAGDKDTYRGNAPGCRIPVLVTQDNSYAIRAPLPGLTLDPDRVIDVEYADPAAYVDAGDFTRAQIRELEQVYLARPVEDRDPFAPPQKKYVYTPGIPLSQLRDMLQLDATSPE